MEMRLDAIEVNTAIPRHVRETIEIFFFRESYLHHDGFDGLLDLVAADLRNDLGSPLRLVPDDTIACPFRVKQCAKLLMDISHDASSGQARKYPFSGR